MARPLLYDCFPFFNELDLLEIRLGTLDPVVDRFVLVEATRSFQKKPKPLHFQEHRQRFAPWLAKIIHVTVDTYPTFWTHFKPIRPRHVDIAQRNRLMEGLADANPEDLILVNDLDEIPRPEVLAQLRDIQDPHVLEVRMYNYFLNFLCVASAEYPMRNGVGYWYGPVIGRFRDVRQTTIDKFRSHRNDPTRPIIRDAGWHFSSVGDVSQVLTKLRNDAHYHEKPKHAVTRQAIEAAMHSGTSVVGHSRFQAQPLDATYPSWLVQHPDRYAHLLAPVSTQA